MLSLKLWLALIKVVWGMLWMVLMVVVLLELAMLMVFGFGRWWLL